MSQELWEPVALGEEAAVYAYGVLIPRLPESERPRGRDALLVHSRARDRARVELAQLGADPGVPGAFELPFAVDDAESARKLGALCEDRLVNIYCVSAGEAPADQRTTFVESARECSARAVQWGQRPEAFPGSGQPVMSPIPTAAKAKSGGGGATATPTQTSTGAATAPSGGDGAAVQP